LGSLVTPFLHWLSSPLWAGAELTPRDLAFAFALLAASFMASRLLRRFLERSPATSHLDPSVRYSLSRLSTYVVVAIGILLALNAVGVGLGTLAVVAGAFGIGIGFGLQTIASNFVSGLILLFERPIRVGDRISLGAVEQNAMGTVNGFVRSISLRATTVVTTDNIALIIPNSSFVTQTIVNWSFGKPMMRLRIPIGVAYGSDLHLVRRILTEAAIENARTLKEPKPLVRLTATAESSLELELLVWIPEPILRGEIESELRWRIIERFREEGVEIPFPHREILLRRDRRDR
jgi:small-conductance mechanosensitive channel